MYEHKQLFDSMLSRVSEIGGEHGLKQPQAFARWFADMYFEHPRDFLATDGSGDGKIDLFFNTSNGREVTHHVLNTKFTSSYNALAPVSFYNEITAFWQAFKNKPNRENYLANIPRRDLRAHYTKLFDHYDDGRARLYFLTDHRRNERQCEAISNYDVGVFHLEDVLQFMADYVENAMPRTPPLRLTGISNILTADENETEVPTSIVFARLTDFIAYMKDDRYDLLFNRNVRLWLGKTKVNEQIRHTFTSAPKEFAYSNNGITVLCESHIAHQGRHEIVINNPRVVNGSQTLHSIRHTANPSASASARVMVRIIEVPQLKANDLPEQVERRKAIIRKIALRSNSQNNIKKWDLVSNDDFQLELARHFRTKKLFYERRKREWSERRTDLKSVGIRKGPNIKDLSQLIASAKWADRQLGPIAAKNPAELFEGERYDKISDTAPERVYQLYLLGAIVNHHLRELGDSKRYVSNAARPMKHALFSMTVRALESAKAEWGRDELTNCLEAEMAASSNRWRMLVSRLMDSIRTVHRQQDKRYRKRAKQPLSWVNFAKSQTYMRDLFVVSIPAKVRSAARAALAD